MILLALHGMKTFNNSVVDSFSLGTILKTLAADTVGLGGQNGVMPIKYHPLATTGMKEPAEQAWR